MIILDENIETTVWTAHETIISSPVPDDSLLNGKLGMILYYHSMFLAYQRSEFADRAYQLLEEIFAGLNSGSTALSGASLGNGACGLTYAVTLLKKNGFLDTDLRAELGELDAYLHQTALQEIEKDHLDYLHGAFGIIWYFTERLPDPVIQAYLEQIIHKLYERRVVTDQGTWFRNYIIDPAEKEEINFSLSHGQCAFLCILCDLLEKGIAENKVRYLLMEGLRFIKGRLQQIDFQHQQYSFFPLSMSPDGSMPPMNHRLAWCYGDLNEALLFYKAGHLLHDQHMIKFADLIGSTSIMRQNTEATLCTDSHFCHGTAGLAQFYHTLYRHTGWDKYNTAREYWGTATARLLARDIDARLFAGKENSLLVGLTGPVLVLSSLITNEELPWTGVFLL
ncbi:lanthionine synthetase LanC family protein [Chitinophaga nivalis]|uniref:Lanthionine synthetase n=1 Tax=Chitinophaga nivalis TaxID=2991709 RepID=A0ABT3INJ5_9BACT|nr:lanthionine synthetase LanC family protein [Chitinophaga nivalis]MCW3464756.1 hypothetical protein [Chitinophaga nivalis]MCW3485553.1 hypothetical protein [Chitinophaga nivalis]